MLKHGKKEVFTLIGARNGTEMNTDIGRIPFMCIAMAYEKAVQGCIEKIFSKMPTAFI